ncbi:hypothetical protein C0Q70_01955 [Pomacea canaliculata]|uniref:Uncharacterized protein n=1 Tax=Pomacea canaliculata TaxID=400727 RepID=A0A2T7Q0X2_POMCA|nr:hypothetical protein C0Q70_01955 [Pomacea canaliculata]
MEYNSLHARAKHDVHGVAPTPSSSDDVWQEWCPFPLASYFVAYTVGLVDENSPLGGVVVDVRWSARAVLGATRHQAPRFSREVFLRGSASRSQ